MNPKRAFTFQAEPTRSVARRPPKSMAVGCRVSDDTAEVILVLDDEIYPLATDRALAYADVLSALCSHSALEAAIMRQLRAAGALHPAQHLTELRAHIPPVDHTATLPVRFDVCHTDDLLPHIDVTRVEDGCRVTQWTLNEAICHAVAMRAAAYDQQMADAYRRMLHDQNPHAAPGQVLAVLNDMAAHADHHDLAFARNLRS